MSRTGRFARAAGMAVAALGMVASLAGNPAQAQDEVKFGFMLGFTGDYAAWAPALNNAALLAVDEINEAGGILGKKVTLVSEDNGSTVSGAIRAAQKLVSVDGVSVIIGPESDPIVSLLQFAKDNKVPVISSSGGTEALDKAGGTGNYIYRTNASDSFLGVAHAKMLIDEMGVTEIPIVVENLEGTISAADTFQRSFERFGGTVTKRIVLTPGQTTYLNELREVADGDPEYVFLAAGQTTGVNIVKQAYQRGYEWTWWVTAELQQPDFIAAATPEVAKGSMSPVSGQRDDSETWQRFSKLYEERFGEKPEPGFYQAETYDAFMAVALAMVAAGDTTGEAVDSNLVNVANPPGKSVLSFADGVAALGAGEEIDYDGASGTVDFNETGNVAIPATRLMQVDESGNWVSIKTIDSSTFPPS